MKRHHARLPKQSRPEWHLIVHRHATSPLRPHARRTRRSPSRVRENRPQAMAIHHRRHGRAAGSPACALDLARRQYRLLNPPASDQEQLQPQPTRQNDGQYLAIALLGTHDPRHRGLSTSRRVHLVQPGEARPRRTATRLAAFLVSSRSMPRVSRSGLGRKCSAEKGLRPKLRRVSFAPGPASPESTQFQ